MFGFHFPPFGGQFAFQDADMMEDDEMIPPKDIDNKELYDILEIPPQSDVEAVKKCYKLLAKKYHPDRPGGNQQKFQLIQKAYEVLSDPDKKKTYDKYGKQGLLRAMNMKNQQFKKCEPYKLEHKITLKDVYQGAYHKKVIPDIQKLCTDCQGQGGKKSTICNVCQGHKIILMRVQVQPGLEMNQQAPCHQCKAKGKMISQSDICKKCEGQGSTLEQVEIEIPIEKGVPDGYCVKLYGQGNQREGYEAGDIFVYLNIEQHLIYIRKGTDLFYQKRITLKEALTGVNLQLQSLDDKEINITTKKIIKPNSILTVKDHGIPFFKDELRNGDLHIQFYVDFPETLDSQTQIQIAKLLPGPQNNILNNPLELQEFSMDEFEKHQQDLDDNQDDENHEIGIDCSIF